MFSFEAMSILGLRLACDESWDETAIQRAWKKKIRLVHPDKNLQKNEESTKLSQQLNEAKDTLLRRLTGSDDGEQERADELKRERERRAHEKGMAEQEAKRKEWEQMYAKMREIRRQNYARNRRKRAPDARVHRKIGDYKEGQALVQEMTAFFQGKFVSNPWNKLLVQDVLDLFVSSRDSTTDLEKNLFKRHGKRLFLAVWPEAGYCTCRSKRCFWHVDIKK